MIPYALLRTALFRLAPEQAHEAALRGLDLAAALHFPTPYVPNLPTTLWGKTLRNPVGLAAGLDKNGDHIDALGRLGFGFVEVGTITPRPQDGNPQPRMFRLPRAQAIINRMGFNNKGVDHLVVRLQEHHYDGLLGVNIGKNKDTANAEAGSDYVHCLHKVYPYAGYITVNLSSPNTVGLRDLQAPAALAALLGEIEQARQRAADQHGQRVPLVVKVAPDLNRDDIPAIAEVIVNSGFDGIIATNTTIQRPGVAGETHAQEAGGLSGTPLKALADDTLKHFRAALPEDFPCIGCGGITQGSDAADKIRLGAQAVQIYSGLIYRGPTLIRAAAKAILTLRESQD